MKVKRSKLLLISAILGTLYLIYIISYFSGNMTGSQGDAERAGAAIATALVMPHMILVLIAVIFNWVGYLGNKRWAALTGAILYAVGGALFIIYLFFVLPSMILSFVGYAKLKKINEINAANANRV